MKSHLRIVRAAHFSHLHRTARARRRPSSLSPDVGHYRPASWILSRFGLGERCATLGANRDCRTGPNLEGAFHGRAAK